MSYITKIVLMLTTSTLLFVTDSFGGPKQKSGYARLPDSLTVKIWDVDSNEGAFSGQIIIVIKGADVRGYFFNGGRTCAEGNWPYYDNLAFAATQNGNGKLSGYVKLCNPPKLAKCPPPIGGQYWKSEFEATVTKVVHTEIYSEIDFITWTIFGNYHGQFVNYPKEKGGPCKVTRRWPVICRMTLKVREFQMQFPGDPDPY